MKFPDGLFFTDKDGTKRAEMRIKWWEDPKKMTYKSISVEAISDLPNKSINFSEIESSDFYSNTDKKIFFGHYWLNGEPSLCKDNICCLDYSVAKGGKLVAYRLNDKSKLENINFKHV